MTEDEPKYLSDVIRQQLTTLRRLHDIVGQLAGHIEYRDERMRQYTERMNELTYRLSQYSEDIAKAVKGFQEASDETQRSTTLLGGLITLIQKQWEEQSQSLKLQHEALREQIRMARESTRTSWVQNGLFFVLGAVASIAVPFASQWLLRLMR